VKRLILAATCCLIVLGFSRVYGQCQNQVCWHNSGSNCWLCIQSGGNYCSTKGRCPVSCTSGNCSGGGSDTASSTLCQASQAAQKELIAEAPLEDPTALVGPLGQTRLTQTETANKLGTAMIVRTPNTSDPVALLAVEHNMQTDLFEHGIAKNMGTADLMAYRVGWFLYPHDGGAPVLREGGLINLPDDGIKPGGQFKVPAQGVSPNLSNDHVMIVSFIQEAKFADGTDWKADTDQVRDAYKNKLEMEIAPAIEKELAARLKK